MDPAGLIYGGSDRDYTYDPAGTWHFSVQHMQVLLRYAPTPAQAAGGIPGNVRRGRIAVDADKQMAGSVLVYDDVDYHWALGPKALEPEHCVPLQLSDRLGLDYFS